MGDASTTTIENRVSGVSSSKIRDKLLVYPLGQGFSSTDVPWKPRCRGYEPGVVGLHNEIKDFYNFIKPTYEDQYVREVVVSRIKDVALSMWPDCKVDVFGSFKTGLYLPTSDIDMVIFGKWKALPLRTLEKALLRSGLSSEITVLDKATVPIVKMADKETGLRVDISFNMINSVKAAELIRGYMQTFPCLPYLVFVLKQFLLQRRLNEVWTGGLSSYALILMVVRFLQEKFSPNWSVESANLGVLLLEFFELYGRLFNYSKTAIRVVDGGEYVRKEVVLQNMVHSIRPSILCIEDPLCPGNDVGRRSYQALLIRQAFEHAYVVLSSAVLPQYCFLHCRTDESILGLVIRVSNTTLECRQRIREFGARLLAASRSRTSDSVRPRDLSPSIHPSAPVAWPIARLPHMYGMNYPVLPNHAMLPFPPNLAIPPAGWHVANGHPRFVLHFPSAVSVSHPVISEPVAVAVNSTDSSTRSTASEPESCTSDTGSTHSTVHEATVEKTVRPSEESMLAEDFASLSTLRHGENHSNSTAIENDKQQPNTKSEDCKRRCLRSPSPTQSTSNQPEMNGTIDATSSSTGQTGTVNQIHGPSKVSVKVPGTGKSSKPPKIRHQAIPCPTPASNNVRDNHYSRNVNTAANAIPCGHKRHSTGARRLK